MNMKTDENGGKRKTTTNISKLLNKIHHSSQPRHKNTNTM